MKGRNKRKTLSERLSNLKFDKRTSLFKKLKSRIEFNESGKIKAGYNRGADKKTLERVVSHAEHFQEVNGNCYNFSHTF